MSDHVPEFAVVGRVNMGKSAVIATLLEIDDNEVLRVSPTPGETTRCQTHRVIFGKKECVRFIDTPGFSRPIEAMRAIRQIHGDGTPGIQTLRQFVEQASDEFGDEKRLLRPLLDGAGVLYVVDPGKPLRDDFLAEMEILRWTGRPRLALLNRRDQDSSANPEQEELWREKLGSTFNLVRTFDAHRAKYDQRLLLMRALLEIEERNRDTLLETISLVEMEWEERRHEAAELIREFLADALELRTRVKLEDRDIRMESRKKKKAEELKSAYFTKLKKLERNCFSGLLKIYRHHLLQLENAEEDFEDIDLESSEVWRKWGLARGQLAMVAAAAGAAGGLVIDIGTGGFSHGLGTLVGGVGGGVGAWFKGGNLPDLRVDLHEGFRISTGETRELVIGPPGNPNFPWILLDGTLIRYARILARAHGRRDLELLGGENPEDSGYTRHFSAERRRTLGKWFNACAKNKRMGGDQEVEVLWAIEATLNEIS